MLGAKQHLQVWCLCMWVWVLLDRPSGKEDACVVREREPARTYKPCWSLIRGTENPNGPCCLWNWCCGCPAAARMLGYGKGVEVEGGSGESGVQPLLHMERGELQIGSCFTPSFQISTKSPHSNQKNTVKEILENTVWLCQVNMLKATIICESWNMRKTSPSCHHFESLGERNFM